MQKFAQNSGGILAGGGLSGANIQDMILKKGMTKK